jgi:hypothetical protein
MFLIILFFGLLLSQGVKIMVKPVTEKDINIRPGDDCGVRTTTYQKHGPYNFNGYYFASETYIKSYTELYTEFYTKVYTTFFLPKIITDTFTDNSKINSHTNSYSKSYSNPYGCTPFNDSQFLKIISLIECDKNLNIHCIPASNYGWECLYGDSLECYRVDRIIPTSNEIPELIKSNGEKCDTNIYSNTIMAYGVWQNNLGTGHYDERKEVYGKIFDEAYMNVYKCCFDSFPDGTVLPVAKCGDNWIVGVYMLGLAMIVIIFGVMISIYSKYKSVDDETIISIITSREPNSEIFIRKIDTTL